MLSILLADDHQNMRQVIANLLKEHADVRLVAEASSFQEVIDLSSEFHPDVILMDVHMADEQKIAPSDLKSSLVDCEVLAMSLWTDDETKARAESFGAVTLLDKANLANELSPSLKLCAQMKSTN
jgi:DNA-binding NarL/FixJ family response regulator